jgi:hypothetical protein
VLGEGGREGGIEREYEMVKKTNYLLETDNTILL